jgi:hypothetical protein
MKMYKPELGRGQPTYLKATSRFQFQNTNRDQDSQESKEEELEEER